MVRQRRFRPERPRSAPLPELLHVLMLPHLERADRIGEFWGYPESRIRRTLDRLRGGPNAPGGDGACLPSLTYPSYRSRLMYGPGACVTIQIAIRAPAALPAPLAWQEGVILAWTPARLGSTNPVSRVAHSSQGPGATSGTAVHQGRPRWVAYCLRTVVPTVPAGLGEGVTRSNGGRSIR